MESLLRSDLSLRITTRGSDPLEVHLYKLENSFWTHLSSAVSFNLAANDMISRS